MQDYLYNLITDRQGGFFAAIFKFFLLLLSFVYSLAVRALAIFYCLRPYRPGCKVISIGNITWGGTGKTPLVELVSRYLKEKRHSLAILSRGYRRSDEPRMLSGNLGDIPVIIDADRARAIKRAAGDYGVDTVVLDDGFQQWRIKKDLEIVTIDATNPFGNRHLIPRGILREPLSALRRADIFMLTRADMSSRVQEIKEILSRLNPKAQIFESVHKPAGFYDLNKEGPVVGQEAFSGKSVTLFSGIGNPDSFEDLIRSLKVNIGLSFRFRDHHIYSREDLDKIIRESENKGIDTIITTEKDAVRLLNLRLKTYDLRLLALRVTLKVIKNEEEFFNRLLRLYST